MLNTSALKIINMVKITKIPCVELYDKNLNELPNELFELTHITRLNLGFNNLNSFIFSEWKTAEN